MFSVIVILGGILLWGLVEYAPKPPVKADQARKDLDDAYEYARLARNPWQF